VYHLSKGAASIDEFCSFFWYTFEARGARQQRKEGLARLAVLSPRVLISSITSFNLQIFALICRQRYHLSAFLSFRQHARTERYSNWRSVERERESSNRGRDGAGILNGLPFPKPTVSHVTFNLIANSSSRGRFFLSCGPITWCGPNLLATMFILVMDFTQEDVERKSDL
jgi:hypothetical protein